MPKQKGRWVAGSATVVALFFLAARGGVPLYDGVGFPDQPYRYLQPPAGGFGTTPAPTSGHGSLPLINGVNDHEGLYGTSEQGPQIVVYIGSQSLQTPDPHSNGTINVSIAPVPLETPPSDGIPDSNDYQVAFTSAAGPLSIRPHSEAGAVTMRQATFDLPQPTYEYRPSAASPWRHLDTRQSGRDTFDAVLAGPGEYLLIRVGAVAGTTRKAPSSDTSLYLALGLAGLLLALTLGGIRILTNRSPTTDEEP